MDESLTALRRTAGQVMAAAVLELFPGTLLVQGQDTSLGFHYDFIFPFPFQQEMLTLIEERMRGMIKEGRPLKMLEMMPANAAAFLEHRGQPRRAKAARAIKNPLVQLVQIENFIDLCIDPCMAQLERIAAFKLHPFLEKGEATRLSGAAFFDKQALKHFLKRLEEHAGRDHVRLGEQLNLFSASPESGWIWHPKGEALRARLLALWHREHTKQQFQFFSRASIQSLPYSLFSRFPRLAEYGYLRQPSDAQSGMFQTDFYLSDRAYILCSEAQLLEECISSLQFMIKISKILSFESRLVLGAKEAVFVQALEKCQVDYDCDLNRQSPGVELRIKDALGREWLGSTLRVEKDRSGERLLIRSTFSSLERIIALLIEQHAGLFPLWLAPEQIRILAVASPHRGYAERVKEVLQGLGWRLTLDERSARLGERVHDALREKIPYCAVIGDREQKEGTVAIRAYGSAQEEIVKVDELTCFTGNRKLDFEN